MHPIWKILMAIVLMAAAVAAIAIPGAVEVYQANLQRLAEPDPIATERAHEAAVNAERSCIAALVDLIELYGRDRFVKEVRTVLADDYYVLVKYDEQQFVAEKMEEK